MLEFALIMPVLLMIGMFVIEILQYHDAQLMADHAAWRLARIAAVRTSGKDGKVTFPKWKSIGSEQVAVALLMSTATTGWSGKGNELLASKIAALFGGESSQTGKFAGTIIGQLGVHAGIFFHPSVFRQPERPDAASAGNGWGTGY